MLIIQYSGPDTTLVGNLDLKKLRSAQNNKNFHSLTLMLNCIIISIWPKLALAWTALVKFWCLFTSFSTSVVKLHLCRALATLTDEESENFTFCVHGFRLIPFIHSFRSRELRWWSIFNFSSDLLLLNTTRNTEVKYFTSNLLIWTALTNAHWLNRKHPTLCYP